MLALPNYTLLGVSYQGPQTIAYQALRKVDAQKVILKTQASEFPSPKDLASFQHEYHLLKDIHYEGVIAVFDLIRHQNRLFLVLENIEGKTIGEILNEKGAFSVGDFLTIAVQLAQVLEKLHEKHIIHKDIKPSNIVIDPVNLKIKIIDFSISSKLSFENQELVNPNILEGTLAYLSPEQTGRMNRLVDYRSDFYSLGVTFYEMLTGKLPFEADDPLELVYAHLAKYPPSVHEVNSKVPPFLSQVVHKLLAKSADDRYNSASGLKMDLLECQQQYTQNQTISSFELGQKDLKNTLVISQQLYGRKEQIDRLLDLFEKVCQTGRSHLVLVGGAPGVGKSAFIQEVYKPISRHKGFFIKGKFDLLLRSNPYHALIQAFKELVQQLLAEPEEKLNVIREAILEALGLNGQVILEFLPELELIIGKQPPVIALGPVEAQNRFNIFFSRFISVFSTQEHPLVIFLDDLQWADQASLTLIEQFLPSSHYIYLAGAFRDNEVGPKHLLNLTLETLEHSKLEITKLTLQPLTYEDVKALFQDTFQQEGVEELATLVFNKTAGNPFFFNEFLKTLYQEELLFFSDGKWQWNKEVIDSKAMADNVLSLMADKIQKLSKPAQEVLTLAACIGAQFDLRTLSTICQKSLQETAALIWESVEAGLVITVGSNYKEIFLLDEEVRTSSGILYKFLHDRIQEAAYQFIPLEERQKMHLKIGRLLLSSKGDEDVLDLVKHFNYSISLLQDSEEKLSVANLNLKAGQKAKLSNAYTEALSYLEAGLSLLPQEAWEDHYELIFNLSKERAECLYILKQPEKARVALIELTEKANNIFDRADIYILLINKLAIEDPELGAQYLIKILKEFGINFPAKISQVGLLKEILKLKLIIAFTPQAKLENLPPMTDIKSQKIMGLYIMAGLAFFSSNQSLFTYLALKGTELGIKGYADYTLIGFLAYLMILIHLRSYKEGKRWLDLTERYIPKTAHFTFVYFSGVGFLVSHWYHPIRDNLIYAKKLYQSALENGNITYIAMSHLCRYYIYNSMGKPLSEVQTACQDAMEPFEKINSWGYYYCTCVLNYVLDVLQGKSSLNQNKVDEFIDKTLHSEPKIAFSSAFLWLYMFYYLSGDFKQALDLKRRVQPFDYLARGLLIEVEGTLFHALILSALYPSFNRWERFSAWRELKSLRKKMKKFADQNPANFLNKYYLIAAEMAALKDKLEEATAFYDRAIKLALEEEFWQYAAIANENAGKFLLRMNLSREAKSYIQGAHYYYSRWEAFSKVQALEKAYPQWLKEKEESIPITVTSITPTSETPALTSTSMASSMPLSTTVPKANTFKSKTEALDYSSVIKATQTLSSEIILNKLLQKLMQLLLENAGAQRGLLLVERGGHLFIEAEGLSSQEDVEIKEQLLEERKDIPLSLISYVQRTKENVVLQNASEEARFSQDPYIREAHPKSVICSPILYQNKVMGFIYLENNATFGAFTKERLEVLSVLSSQAAISLENARLYIASGKFVPAEFLHLLQKRSLVDVQLGDHINRSMSVLFCDIRNFTILSETMTPAENFQFINEFLGYMEPIIRHHEGFIDKYIGDAIMALFTGQAEEALEAAISMLDKLKLFNEGRVRQGKNSIRIGIGINTGDLILGIVGGMQRMESSVIGDTVNVASHIESMTKTYGVSLIIGNNTKEKLADPSRYALRLIDQVSAKGKTKLIDIWEVCAVDPQEIKEAKIRTLEQFNLARQAFNEQAIEKAKKLFQNCLEQSPHDSVTKLYLTRCEQVIA